ncbi:LacI family DNA-binding transcriptional regulator [Parasedimentitalea psychrophila]|uniref:LacI family DNA-binding transcriptional regulator n=1 Tax=Parasedimentitalea psychrophila TaxID=2997337 RepID=A0A9Y2KX51_9RHOB|nr:LacI family DNA-binding transcriptional regulator [Parasedimentitalea psychrophila]WIY24755.1 LacI family DNA-binding transcriptional regulator [Parasedimentitalea psychrophila]
MARSRDKPFAKATETVRIEDVAKLAGVAPITVSRALQNPGKVRESTRLKVAEAVKKTGYVANPFASNLRSGSSNIISFFVSDLRNPHFSNAMQGSADALEGSAYKLMMSQIGYSEEVEAEALNSVLPMRPAALVFTGLVQSTATRARLRDQNIPVMEMWDFTPDPIDMLVGFSNYEGGRMMGQHFGKCGYKHIAYVGRSQGRGAQRLQGFQEALLNTGASVERIFPMEGGRSLADGKKALGDLLEQFPDVDAVFFGTDTLAVGAIFECRTRGINLPEDLAIAGFGDLEVSGQLSTPLTTIHVASYEMGYEAGKILRNRLEGRDGEVTNATKLFPVTLMARITA